MCGCDWGITFNREMFLFMYLLVMINIIQSIQIPKHVKKNNNNHNNNNKKLTNKNKNCYHSWHLAASIICKGNTREILEKSARNPREIRKNS